jgi:hypothetical protein
MTSHARLLAGYSSASTAVLTAISFSLACYAVPIAGPYCPYESDCIRYPYYVYYVRIADRFPRDYLWMIASIPQLMAYLIMMASVQAWCPSNKKIYGTIALVFATVSTTILVSDYFVQLSVIQPSILAGETDYGLALLTMYNDKGVFIALEEVGYIFMSASFFAMAPLFSGILRFFLVAAFVSTVVSLIYYIVSFGWGRSYRFEVAVIFIDWMTLIVCGTMMALRFLRADKNEKLD